MSLLSTIIVIICLTSVFSHKISTILNAKAYKKNNTISKKNKMTKYFSLIQKETPHHAPLQIKSKRNSLYKGSFTIEASIILPLFMAFMMFMLYFMRIVMVEEGVQQALNKSVREVAAATTSYTEHKGAVATTSAIAKTHIHLKDDPFIDKFVTLGNWAIVYTDNDYEDNYVTIIANYNIGFPINFFGRINTHVTQSARSRMWVGDDPNEDVQPSANEEEDSDYVYVCETGVVYHDSRECAYLELSIRMVPGNTLSSERNKDGKKYYPCSKCKPGNVGSGNYYVTDYGTVYHNSLSCSGLKRTVSVVKKEEAIASGKGGCSKCAK